MQPIFSQPIRASEPAASQTAARDASPDTVTEILAAVTSNDIARVRSLARHFHQQFEACDSQEYGLIHRAIDRRVSAAMLTELLSAGAAPNRRDAQGLTPLHRASIAGDIATVDALLDRGADPNLLTRDGRHAVELASNAECQRCIFETAALGRSAVRLRRHPGPVGFMIWLAGEARRSGYCNLL